LAERKRKWVPGEIPIEKPPRPPEKVPVPKKLPRVPPVVPPAPPIPAEVTLRDLIEELRRIQESTIIELRRLRDLEFLPVVQKIVDGYELRDTREHFSEIADMRLFKIANIWIDNDLDQALTITVYGNREKTYDEAVQIGDPFTVNADDTESRTLTPDTSGWYPYIFIKYKADVKPTKKRLNVWVLKKR